MPWMETSPVEQRERFIADHRLGLYTMTELCARATASVGRRATSGSGASTAAAGRRSRTGVARRITVRTGSRTRSRSCC